MGVFSGPITYRKYRVVGELEGSFQEGFMEAILKNRHKDIDPQSEDELRVGWVQIGDLLADEPVFDKVFYAGKLFLTMRMDTLRLPAASLRVYLTQAEEEFREATGKERLSKADREEVRDMVTKQLRKRAIPGIKGFDMVWDFENKSVRFWSLSKAPCEEFEHLFTETFGFRLIPRTPFTAIDESIGLSDDVATAALGLEPADFVGIQE